MVEQQIRWKYFKKYVQQYLYKLGKGRGMIDYTKRDFDPKKMMLTMRKYKGYQVIHKPNRAKALDPLYPENLTELQASIAVKQVKIRAAWSYLPEGLGVTPEILDQLIEQSEEVLDGVTNQAVKVEWPKE